MKKISLLEHERVDDIPLLIGLMKNMGLPAIINRAIPRHGNHTGLDHGSMAMAWLAYILSEGDHRKVSVEPWAGLRLLSMQSLLGQTMSAKDFTDDRLGILLKHLGNDEAWESIEQQLWDKTIRVIPPNNGIPGIRLDATTVSGYHTIVENLLMQHGNSKAHRPDLGQFKLMSASHQPSGCLIATSIHPGQTADDPLYVPIMQRVQGILGQEGLLFCGDCKMAAVATRAYVVRTNCHYLVPLPMTGKVADWLYDLILFAEDHPGELEELAGLPEGSVGFETSRVERHVDPASGEITEWPERVLVVRTSEFAAKKEATLDRKLDEAEEAIKRLTPEPGRGKRAFRSEEALRAAIREIEEQKGVTGFLSVSLERRESRKTKLVGRGRGGKNRESQEVVEARYFVQMVIRLEDVVEEQKNYLGWRIFTTTMLSDALPLAQAILEYRKGWCLEKSFHLLKEQPIGISPLFVQTDEQIKGLTHLLLLANRILSEIELRVRGSLQAAGEQLTGLSLGSPKQGTAKPTAASLLKRVSRDQITLTRIVMGKAVAFHLSAISPTVERILHHLGLNSSIYDCLQEIGET
jgi:transposase